ncbi:MAG: hypothetical protein IPL40_00420 [Proteobacteria bacterium]|nr:hypothetical protein [Pseudomonadota bacterium]
MSEAEQSEAAAGAGAPEEGGRLRDEPLRQRLEALVPDVLRRTLYAGLGAILTPEESIRRLANDFSLPKDVAGYLVGQAQTTKSELVRLVAAEVRRVLEGMRINEELQRLLTSMTIELRTEVRFVPNEERLQPQVKHEVHVHEGRAARPTEVIVPPPGQPGGGAAGAVPAADDDPH